MNHKNAAVKTPANGVEIKRKEIADLFNVSIETVKRRTNEGHLNPVALNSRVMHYGEKDIQAMAQMGYRLDEALSRKLGLSNVSSHPLQDSSREQLHSASQPDHHMELLKLLRKHNDPISKHIILRFAANLILTDDMI
jgi:hypothetical protein